MIYERFGKWWGHFSLLDLLAVNFLTLITEFAAISLAPCALGVSHSISVPVSALWLTLMVVTGSYLRWEQNTASSFNPYRQTQGLRSLRRTEKRPPPTRILVLPGPPERVLPSSAADPGCVSR